MQDQVNAFPDRYALYLGIENEKIIEELNNALGVSFGLEE